MGRKRSWTTRGDWTGPFSCVLSANELIRPAKWSIDFARLGHFKPDDPLLGERAGLARLKMLGPYLAANEKTVAHGEVLQDCHLDAHRFAGGRWLTGTVQFQKVRIAGLAPTQNP